MTGRHRHRVRKLRQLAKLLLRRLHWKLRLILDRPAPKERMALAALREGVPPQCRRRSLCRLLFSVRNRRAFAIHRDRTTKLLLLLVIVLHLRLFNDRTRRERGGHDLVVMLLRERLRRLLSGCRHELLIMRMKRLLLLLLCGRGEGRLGRLLESSQAFL